MKPALFIIITIVILIAAAFLILNNTSGKSQNSSPTKSVNTVMNNAITIKITADSYIPNKITIKKGQTVTFINESGGERWPASNIHPTHEIYPQFDPKKAIKSGESWSFKFDKEGIWRFHDHLLPALTGTITVE